MKAGRGIEGSASKVDTRRCRKFCSRSLVCALAKKGVDFGFLCLYVKVDCGGVGAFSSACAPGAGSVEDRKANLFSVLNFCISHKLDSRALLTPRVIR